MIFFFFYVTGYSYNYEVKDMTRKWIKIILFLELFFA